MSPHAIRVSPRPLLAPYVRHIRSAPAQHEQRAYVRLPDGELELVVRVGQRSPSVLAIGTRLQPLHTPGYEREQAFAVRFKAGGAYPFFGMPVSELTDRVISVAELWGDAGARLSDALEQADHQAAYISAIETALSARLAPRTLFEPASAASVRRAVRMLQQSAALPSVKGLAEQLGASPRQLRRSFAAVTGLGPKEFLRVLRFQRALRSARQEPTPHWGSLAVQHGYYDQAHLIAEFRALAGTTPAAFWERSRGSRPRPAQTSAAKTSARGRENRAGTAPAGLHPG